MALTASAKSNTVSTPAPAGNHVARCVRVIDLGIQKEERGQYAGKINHKLMLCWELPTELHTFKDEKGPEPFMLSSEYTVSLGEKANLRRDLESWRGRAFTAVELDAFDVANVLGAPCLLNVVHKIATNKNTYANVKGITPLPKGFVCPPAISPLLRYEVEMGKNEVFEALPEWIRNKIVGCEDWKAKPAANEGTTTPDPSDYADINAEAAAADSSIPF
jgi:hypothetical protein